MATTTGTSQTIGLVGGLLGALDPLADELTDQIFKSEHAYSEHEQDSHTQIRTAVRNNLRGLLTALDGHPVSLDAAREAGRLKAELGIPLAALLHAYRLGGRFIWDRLLVAAGDGSQATELLHMASDVWLIIDEHASAAADAYRTAIEEQARQDAAARQALLTALLDGSTASDSRAAEIIRVLRMPPDGPFLVVSAEITDTDGLLPSATAKLRAAGVVSEWARLAGAAVGILTLPRHHTAENTVGLLGTVVTGRAGVSRVFTTPLDASRAWREAQLATRCLPPGTSGAHSYGESPVALLVAAAPEVATDMSRSVFASLDLLPLVERSTLLETLSTWFAVGGSTSKTAEALHCHRNTVLYRLTRIGELTGRHATDAVGSAELYLALQVRRQEGGSASEPGAGAGPAAFIPQAQRRAVA